MKIPLYGQRDPRWASQLLNNVRGSNIGAYGCTTACIGMISGRNPGQEETFLRNSGGYASDLVNWTRIAGFKSRFYCEQTPAPLENIKNEIRAGRPVLLNVYLGGGSPKPNHWVLCVDENFTINDPWYNERVNITKRYGQPGVAILGGAYFNPQSNLGKTMKHIQNLRYSNGATVYMIYAAETMDEVNATGKDIELCAPPRLIRDVGNPEVSFAYGIPNFAMVAYLGLHPEDTIDNFDKKEIGVLDRKLKNTQTRLQEELDNSNELEDINHEQQGKIEGLITQTNNLQVKLTACEQSKSVVTGVSGVVEVKTGTYVGSIKEKQKVQSLFSKAIKFFSNLLSKK